MKSENTLVKMKEGTDIHSIERRHRMCQGENIMEDNRREEKEALKVLTEYSPKLLKSMRNVMEELHGNRQPDTDEYLLSIIKGMN